MEGMRQILGYKIESDGKVTTLSQVNLFSIRSSMWNYSYQMTKIRLIFSVQLARQSRLYDEYVL
jgi:hypothetical protein